MQKHEKKFKLLKELVDHTTLGDYLMELKTSFDFSGQVEMRVVPPRTVTQSVASSKVVPGAIVDAGVCHAKGPLPLHLEQLHGATLVVSAGD